MCVSGRSGVTVGAEKAFQLARKNGKATMVFISKCDLENANYFKILEEMKIKFGSTVCPCVVPAKLDDGTPVYIKMCIRDRTEIQDGTFASEFLTEMSPKGGRKVHFLAERRMQAEHPIEKVGAELRSMMSWLKK